MPEATPMDNTVLALLEIGSLSSLRHDDIVARQGVMNHQSSAHLMDLSFINAQTEISIPESYAIQGLAASQLPREASGINLAAQTPKKQD